MRRVAATVVLVVAVAACGGDGDGDADGAAAPADGNTVVLRGIAFRPDEVTIAVGETVTWRWDDGNVVHDVVFDDFRSKLQSEGEYRHTFDEAGTFEYVCSVHPQMKGTVVVDDA